MTSLTSHRLERQPWVEKYRPTRLQDVKAQDQIRNFMYQILESHDMPHVLFYGPPGTGKTSLALAFAREAFGSIWRDRILELNASDQRGIDVIRNRVKTWCKTVCVQPKKNIISQHGDVEMADDHSIENIINKQKRLPDWKLVILDEADQLTSDAQSALRRIMEDFTNTTRFIIICNYVSKIIDPILSRCAIFRFQPITAESQIERLSFVSGKENIQIDKTALELIVDLSACDLRKALCLLQTSAAVADKLITTETIYAIAGVPVNTIATDLLKSCSEANSSICESQVEQITRQGWDVSILMIQFCDAAFDRDNISDVQKSFIAHSASVAQHRLLKGGSPYAELLFLALETHQTLNKLK